MTIKLSVLFRQKLISIINANNNVNYDITDINNIMFHLSKISIWMNDDNLFSINYNILNSVKLIDRK